MDKRPVLRFVIALGLLLAVFNALFYPWFSTGDLFLSYLSFNAECSAAVIRAFGGSVTVDGTELMTAQFAIDVKRGCDAMQASAVFVLAVLASPAPVSLLAKLQPVIAGR